MHFRLATPADGDALAAIYAPSVNGSAISFELDAPTGAEMSRRVAATIARTPWLVGVHEETVIGYAYAGRHRERDGYAWSIDVSAYVSPTVQRMGVGRALYRYLFGILVLQGYRNAYAGVALPNEASIRLHESVGFTRVGVYKNVGYKLGRWHDVAWFERSLGLHDSNPPLPRPLIEVQQEAEALLTP